MTSTFSNKPLITVFGATGQQGGSIARALLADGHFRVRGITRKPDSHSAKKLVEQGAEVIFGDLRYVEALREAMKGAYGVFAVTNFWDPSSMGKEVDQGKLMVDVAIESNVQHFIWSTLVNVQKLSKGKYQVPHFTHKALVEEYAREQLPKHNIKGSYIAAPFYYQNFMSLLAPEKAPDGTFVFNLPIPPNAYITAADIDDIGAIVLQMFKNGDQYNGKTVAFAGEHQHPQYYINAMANATGVKVALNSMTPEEYARLDTPGAKEVAEMFAWFADSTYFGHQLDMWEGKKIHPKIKDFPTWLQENRNFTLQSKWQSK